MKLSEEDRAFWNSRIPKCSLCGSTKVATLRRGGPLFDHEVDAHGSGTFGDPHLQTCPGVR